jgi:hypothetical protein
MRRRAVSTHGRILAHYKEVWPGQDLVDSHWTPGSMAWRLPSLHIVKVAPSSTATMWTFATIGASDVTRGEPTGLEFVAVATSESAAVITRLGWIAWYHAGPPENRLGAGHTVPIGEGWVEGSPLDSILLTLPYLWGPRLEHCPIGDRHIQVLWAVPIHQSELDFKIAHGLDALEQRFEEQHVEYLDPFRPPVA